MLIQFHLNSASVEIDSLSGTTLLEYLRENNIFSPKYGCDHGECGACAILIDDKAMNSCLILMHTIEGKRIETAECLGNNRELTAIQEQFLEEGAVQCGYCTPGMIIALEALRREKPAYSENDVRDALAGSLCRCTGYVKPVIAALKSSGRERGTL